MNGLTPEQVAQMMSMLQANQQPMQPQAPQHTAALSGFFIEEAESQGLTGALTDEMGMSTIVYWK